MANFQLKGMEDAITCSICSDLFTDARTLPCDHCFCLECLRTFQCSAVIKPCPTCRKDTVPAARELHRLPSNKAVNEMVGLLVRHKAEGNGNESQPKNAAVQNVSSISRPSPPPYTPRKQQNPAPAPEAKTQRANAASGITLAELLGGTSGARVAQQQRAEAQAKALAEARLKSLVEAKAQARLEALVEAQAKAQAEARLKALVESHAKAQAEARAEAMAEALAEAFMGALTTNDSGNTHRFVKCDECGTNNISGARFKCGICDDYDLCENCEKRPRQLVHDRTHIFIKLRRPATRRIPQGRVLDIIALGIGRNMNFNSNVQTLRTSLDLLGLISAQVPIDCDRCGEKPIVGKRFKCGMCEGYDLCEDCERNCTSFHPSDHVFLVIRHPSTQDGQCKRLTRCDFY